MIDSPHRRFNALTGDWVSVSPHRAQRPWQGQDERPAAPGAQYDSACYLCPGNERANGKRNPAYTSTHAFTNDFAAFLPDVKFRTPERDHPLLQEQQVCGTCRVLCFSPRHDLTLAQMTPEQIRGVIDLWAEQIRELSRTNRWVQVFENKGEIMGCSNAHPHGQVWASSSLPREAEKELDQQRSWKKEHRTVLLIEYAQLERETKDRLVVETDHWLAVVPWWAVWPFETLILPRRHVTRLPEVLDDERNDLAALLKQLLSGYDRLFDTSFPYSMGWHSAPTFSGNVSSWQLHAHIYPPLLRSATVKKFMVGYELLAESQRDITAEQAAERLRAVVAAQRTA